ncbi:MAG TPA: S8 family serine peptidase [Jiangellaceae bacterium]|nr:S8 family serine peptidase [Jiangellaceae bacterium]
MGTKHVIAYAMHETELAAAGPIVENAQWTASYVIGDVDEDRIEELEQAGLVVDEVAPAGRPTTAAMARGTLAAETGVEGWRAGGDDEIAQPEPGSPTQWLVSLTSPLMGDMREALGATGAQLDEYIPHHAYVATATPEQAAEVINLPFVRDVERYGPSKTGPIVLTAGGEDRGEGDAARVWDLWLSDASVRHQVLSWLAQNDVSVVGDGGRRVRLALPAGSGLQREISTLPGVLSMVEHVPPKLFNDVARGLLGVTSDTTERSLPLTGAGQVVAVADTGLHETHPDFAGRVVEVVALGRPNDASDPHGHGTHVAGSVLADGSASDGSFAGVAPEAKLYFQSLLDPQGGLGGLPVSLEDLFEPAYQAGARVHNNSWGAATASAYTVDSNDVDAYAAKRRDMLIVIAAGNEGTAADPFNSEPGFVDWLSIGSPASCKNALTVGAARNRRTAGGLSGRTYGDTWRQDFPKPPIADQRVSGDPECMAAFSSRGPCDDRRIKPDIVAPGTDIVSTRSDIAPDDHFWGLVDDNPAYAYMGGTSMACPLVAGCAALVRQYFVDQRDSSPSAALLKATLVNGARWLSGPDSVADREARPNFHQGFGAVNLTTTVPNPAEPDLRLEFVDCWETPNLQLGETGERRRFQVDVEAGMPLRLCMAYTDLPGRSLQNDLSVMVQDPTGAKIAGNTGLPEITRSDVDNNVEVIRVDDPAPGRWLIQVFARNLLRPPQDYALVVTGALSSALRRAPG